MIKKIWKWLGKIGKYVTRITAIFFLVMALLTIIPGSTGKWAWNFWVSIDQFANAMTFGDPDETISSRLGKWITQEDAGWIRKSSGNIICFFLDFVDKDHCHNSIDYEEGKDALTF